jgi:hypothetical protein
VATREMVISTDGAARRLLLVLGIVDLFCGALGIPATHELAHILRTSAAVPIVISCRRYSSWAWRDCSRPAVSQRSYADAFACSPY